MTQKERAEAQVTEAVNEEVEPDSKKRRTQLRPFAAPSGSAAPPAGSAAPPAMLQHRVQEMENKQHSIDKQLAALMKMMQKLTVTMGQGAEEEEPLQTMDMTPAKADDSISIDSSDA